MSENSRHRVSRPVRRQYATQLLLQANHPSQDLPHLPIGPRLPDRSTGFGPLAVASVLVVGPSGRYLDYTRSFVLPSKRLAGEVRTKIASEASTFLDSLALALQGTTGASGSADASQGDDDG